MGLVQRSHGPLSHTRGDPVPNPTNVCGTALAIPTSGSTKPVGNSSLSRWPNSTNLRKKRNTPQLHLRTPRPGCRLTTAQRSCCHEAEPMEKPAPSLTLENVLSVARRLGVCRSTIHAWVQRGRFPAPIKVGRSSRC